MAIELSLFRGALYKRILDAMHAALYNGKHIECQGNKSFDFRVPSATVGVILSHYLKVRNSGAYIIT